MKKLNIRDVLLAATIAALALGWWTDHRMTHARLSKTKSELEAKISELEAANRQIRQSGMPFLYAPVDDRKVETFTVRPKRTTKKWRWLPW